MSLPSPIIAVLAHFQPLFTVPTWKKVVTLLIGTLLARGRRTVTTALWQMGHQMDAHFSLFHQVLNRARWSSLSGKLLGIPRHRQPSAISSPQCVGICGTDRLFRHRLLTPISV